MKRYHIGDKVRVVSKVDDYNDGYWNPLHEMDIYLGNVYTICDVDTNWDNEVKYILEGENGIDEWCFFDHMLEPVTINRPDRLVIKNIKRSE